MLFSQDEISPICGFEIFFQNSKCRNQYVEALPVQKKPKICMWKRCWLLFNEKPVLFLAFYRLIDNLQAQKFI